MARIIGFFYDFMGIQMASLSFMLFLQLSFSLCSLLDGLVKIWGFIRYKNLKTNNQIKFHTRVKGVMLFFED